MTASAALRLLALGLALGMATPVAAQERAPDESDPHRHGPGLLLGGHAGRPLGLSLFAAPTLGLGDQVQGEAFAGGELSTRGHRASLGWALCHAACVYAMSVRASRLVVTRDRGAFTPGAPYWGGEVHVTAPALVGVRYGLFVRQRPDGRGRRVAHAVDAAFLLRLLADRGRGERLAPR